MESISDLLPLLLCSILLQATFLTWRRLSHTWDSWFPPFQKAAKAVLWIFVAGLVLGLTIFFGKSEAQLGLKALVVVLGLGTFAIFKKFSGDRAPKERTERGAVIATSQEVRTLVKTQAKKTGQSADLVLGGVPLPKDAEPYHFLVSGSTGSGKSVAIRGLLDVLRARGDTVILVDSGGEFLSKYWDDDKDVLINPFDARCAPWSPLAEIEGPWDTGALARSIVPDGTGETKEWNSYAQTFLSSCMQSLSAQGRTKLSDLLWAVQQATMKELQPLLAGTPAASQLGSEKTFGSIRTIAGNYMASYNYLEDNDNDAFSVSEFVKHAKGNFLYLTYRDDQLDSIRHMLSCILDIASRAILSLQPDPDRRVWLIIDEFASIGKVQSIETVATKARKVGGCLVIGIQSVAQLKDRYGEHQAQSILSCLSNSLTLRCADGDTAELMSRNLGEAEVIRATAGSSSSDTGIDSRSWNEQKSTQRLVLPSQLQQLKNLQGFLKISGSYPVCEVNLVPPKNRDTVTSPFEARDFRAKPLMGMPATLPTAAEPRAAAVRDTAGARASSEYQGSSSGGLQSFGEERAPAVERELITSAERAEPIVAPRAQPRAEIVVTLKPRRPSVAVVVPTQSTATSTPDLSSGALPQVQAVTERHEPTVPPVQEPPAQAASTIDQAPSRSDEVVEVTAPKVSQPHPTVGAPHENAGRREPRPGPRTPKHEAEPARAVKAEKPVQPGAPDAKPQAATPAVSEGRNQSRRQRGGRAR